MTNISVHTNFIFGLFLFSTNKWFIMLYEIDNCHTNCQLDYFLTKLYCYQLVICMCEGEKDRFILTRIYQPLTATGFVTDQINQLVHKKNRERESTEEKIVCIVIFNVCRKCNNIFLLVLPTWVRATDMWKGHRLLYSSTRLAFLRRPSYSIWNKKRESLYWQHIIFLCRYGKEVSFLFFRFIHCTFILTICSSLLP